MRVALLNSVCSGSTGRIMCGIARRLMDAGHEGRVFYGRGSAPQDVSCTRVTGKLSVYSHVLKARALDRSGFGSAAATRALVRQLEAYDPDAVHLHNLHGYWLHLPTLFAWLRGCGKPVIWTLHDCWSFTGHCAYFDAVGCARWQAGDGCRACPQMRAYPRSLFVDHSARNFAEKRGLYADLSNLTLAAPSRWLAELTRMSFLGSLPVAVLPNGVDRSTFLPAPSDLRARYGLAGKRVLLGVANVWEPRKGLDTFWELRTRMDENVAIVLIGLSKRQLDAVPAGILGLPRTASAAELAAWYTAADVLVDPTREENFPTTHLEALSCGTPVATFCAGGSAEMLTPLCGASAPVGDVAALAGAMAHAVTCKADDCVAQSALYDEKQRFDAYIQLYFTQCKGVNA